MDSHKSRVIWEVCQVLSTWGERLKKKKAISLLILGIKNELKLKAVLLEIINYEREKEIKTDNRFFVFHRM